MKKPVNLNIINNEDERGILTACEIYKQTNCLFKRFFIISNIIGGKRGGHAHKYTDQVIHCVQGNFILELEYNNINMVYHLDQSSSAVFTPALTWVDMTNISNDCIILVLSTDEYNIRNSLRSYREYKEYLSFVS